MGTRNKKKINVERVGNSGHPITTNPTPVRHVMFQDKIPYTTFSNGTVVQSTVNKDGVNEQILRKSNLNPAYKLEVKHDGVSTPDTLGLYRANHPSDLWAYDKIKPGTKEYKEAVEKFNSYGIPLATYGEAYDNLEEVERQVNELQAGGSIASRLWNKWTGKDTYTDGYGTTRSHVPVRESAHRTAIKAADSPLIQAIPVVGDIADGYVAADYAAKGDYKPAMVAIGAGLISPDFLEVGARFIPKDTWRDALKKLDDVDLTTTIKRDLPDDAKKYLDDVKSGKVKLTKDINEMTDNEKEALLYQLNSNSSLLSRSGKHRTPSQNYRNTTPVDDDIDKVWIPQETYTDDGDIIDYGTSKQSNEPWWGWDPVEYQDGGEIPSNAAVSFLENLPYGRHNVNEHNKLVEMGKRFGNNIPGSVKPIPLPNKYQPTVPPVKMPTHKQDSSDIKPAPMPIYPGQSIDRMPMHKDNKFAIPQEMYQEGGNLPSDDQQQQLFVAIITDMAKTLGVEPSQELAEAVMAAFENNDDSQGLLTLFTKTKDKFMNETGLFREGGKMIAFIEKFGCGGKSPKKKTSKKQEGGEVELTRRQAKDLSKLNKGFDNGDFRMAYQNAKNTLANNTDLTGRERRMAARRMVSGINDVAPATPTLGPAPQAQLNVPTPQLGTPASLEHNYDNFDFNTAFGRARGNGEDIFTWKGKEYTTELAPEKKSVTSNPDLLMGSPTTGGNYYDPNTNPMYQLGAKWGAKWRANRDARRAARNEREAALRAKVAEMNANYEPVSFTEAAMKVTPSRRS